MKKKSGLRDPHAKRESEKYQNPIASREYILSVLEASTGPLTHQSLCKVLQLDTPEEIEALRRRLRAMERDGQLIANRKGGYGRVDKMDLVRGRVQGHRDGYGFFIPADGTQDLYLTSRQMRKVFDGDEVLVRVGSKDYKGRCEATIVEVLSHNTHQLVGRFYNERGIQFVRPDNPRLGHDVHILPGQTQGAAPGQFVVVEITQQPDRRNLPAGQIIEVMGDHLAPGMEIDVAIRSHGVPYLWPVEVQKQIESFGREVKESDKKHRIDLRDIPFVTIDGEDARDFDDAVYCERKRSGGWRLFVAIADVSHYVAIGGALDQEAIVRGNSVYFPDFVVPMLPEVLSNGLCSLNPNVDRLCMVCEMTISERGKLSGYKFYEGVMHSHARLTYSQVGQIIGEQNQKRSGIRQQYHLLLKHLDELHNLFLALRTTRESRGAIDFETQETRIQFDDDRKIKCIVPVERNDAHKLIEECMLAANVCAARFLDAHDLPGLYRVHEKPKAEKMDMLYEFLGELGLSVRGGEISPQHYQEVLDGIQGRPDAHLIQTVMLRSMNQAVYQPDNIGHFGLAYPAYAHFTSPIRRYPDLLVHRAIRRVIRSDIETTKVLRHEKSRRLKTNKLYPYEFSDMLSFGEQCSLTERRADDATRDVVSWLKCEYLQDRVGEVFEGVVSSVVAFGLFVELKDVYVEGLIHITSLPQDYYHHQPAQHRLVGERTNRIFRLGDEITVQVVRVDLDERKIDLELTSVKKQKRRRTRVSTEAKKLADDYSKEETRRAGGSQSRKKHKQQKSVEVEHSQDPNADKPGTKKTRTKKSKVRKTKSSTKKKSVVKSASKKKTQAKKKTAKKANHVASNDKPPSTSARKPRKRKPRK